jgi:hypothetical protein
MLLLRQPLPPPSPLQPLPLSLLHCRRLDDYKTTTMTIRQCLHCHRRYSRRCRVAVIILTTEKRQL